MTDRIDTDAIRGHYLSGVGLRRANWEAYIFSDLARLCDEVDRLRAARELSDDEAMIVENARTRFDGEHRVQMAWGEFLGAELLAVIDRLADGAAP